MGDHNLFIKKVYHKACDHLNIVIVPNASNENLRLDAPQSKQEDDFLTRILYNQLTILRTRDILPHLVKKRKKLLVNGQGKRVRLNRVITYDESVHINVNKKGIGYGKVLYKASSSKRPQLSEECRNGYRAVFEKIFRNANDDTKVSISRNDFMKLLKEQEMETSVVASTVEVRTNSSNMENKHNGSGKDVGHICPVVEATVAGRTDDPNTEDEDNGSAQKPGVFSRPVSI